MKTDETKTVEKKHGESEVSTVPATENPSLPASVPAVGPAEPDTSNPTDSNGKDGPGQTPYRS